ncbi:MAG: hypothetical protein GWO39_14855, partial [Gammaproteobacteria bacterium]|nr:hypothetical protein [Gemmatimonadota bacterium]NIT64978.1 hypothetical protein [Gammaproteobacteria bacterium]NIU80514.1 hypothetical protein [Gammaproteobacteria bacterium]NIV21996.1 hypothetical protein [Gammaproteobacteria bacterium]NIW77900.1 hypothetical protein [Gemmatimonadota bacterium]
YKGDQRFAYDCGLVLEGAEASTFASQVDALLKEHAAEAGARSVRPPPYVDHTDRDGNVIPGAVRFKFKVPAEIQTKRGPWVRKPKIADSLGKLVDTEGLTIGTGTEARIAFTVYLTQGGGQAGLRLEPVGVQIRKLVEAFQPSDEVTFEAMDDGFAADEPGSFEEEGEV